MPRPAQFALPFGGGFGGSEMRDAITLGGTQGPISPTRDQAFFDRPSSALLTPSAVNAPRVTSPSQSFAAIGDQMAAGGGQAAPAAPGSVGTPLGGLLQTAISPLTGLVKQGAENFRQGFATESSVARRAAQLANQNISQFAQDNDIGLDALNPDQVKQLQADAQAQAEAEGAEQNQAAFGTVVGSRLITSGVNSLLAAKAAEDEIENIQRSTERFINGVEFNSRLQKQAQNIAEMRNRLRMIDSLMQQGSGTLAGGQQQLFLRNPNTGLQV